jgi:ATP/maltotriose-dependent transcriptional regulator MalT
MLPIESLDRNPELLVLMSWLHVIYARPAELTSSLQKAEALALVRTTGEHVQGHLDALYGFYQWLTVNGEQALTRTRRACATIPRHHRWARVFAFIARGLVHQMLGDRAKALSTIDEAMRDPGLSGGGTQGFFQANPCFIHWIDADLTNLLQTAAQSLKLVENGRAFQARAHGLYFLGIAHYHRNELNTAEENLTAVITTRIRNMH